jgi:protein-disulfide isomerase
MTISKPLLAVVIGAVVAIFLGGARWYRASEVDSASTTVGADAERLVRPHSISVGPADAPVTIVEFFDPECESCRAMYPIVKQVLTDVGNRARLVIRYMPLHQNSVQAATLLEAAREQNRYGEYLDIVMARQPEWGDHAAPRPDLLLTYAPTAGLDTERLRVAATNPDIRARIEQDEADGRALGVSGTPTFFVNGRVLPQLGYGPLRAAVEAALP